MKRVLPLLLALLLLTACSAPAVEPTADETPVETLAPASSAIPELTPEPTPNTNPYGMQDWMLEEPQLPYPDPGEAYLYINDTLGLAIPVPAEIANAVRIEGGYGGWADADTSDSCIYVPGIQSSSYGGRLYAIILVPRRELFSADNWFFHVMATAEVLAMGRDYAYLYMPSIGGSDVPRNAMLGAYKTHDLFGLDYLRENMLVKSPDSIPHMNGEAMLEAAKSLEAGGDAVMTRAEAAQLIYDMMDAENKGTWYTIEYDDIWIGSPHGKAIAYLASYGMFSPDNSFRPDDLITRAEFVALLQRAVLYMNIDWFGDPVESEGFDRSHWAYDPLNRAWQDGWIETGNGGLRPDDPITAAEMAAALNAAYDMPNVGK